MVSLICSVLLTLPLLKLLLLKCLLVSQIWTKCYWTQPATLALICQLPNSVTPLASSIQYSRNLWKMLMTLHVIFASSRLTTSLKWDSNLEKKLCYRMLSSAGLFPILCNSLLYSKPKHICISVASLKCVVLLSCNDDWKPNLRSTQHAQNTLQRPQVWLCP